MNTITEGQHEPEKPKCLLCTKPRDNHEIGCLEPLIVAESISQTLESVANSLGIIIAENNDEDKIGFCFRRYTNGEQCKCENEDCECDTAILAVKGKKSRDIIFYILDKLQRDLDNRDITLIPRHEALERAKAILL